MIQVRRVLFGLAVAALPLFAGCSAKSTSVTPTPPPVASFMYYTVPELVVGQPAIGVVAYPVTSASTPSLTVNVSAANGLADPTALLVDSQGRLFVLNDPGNPATVGVFALPLTATSVPLFTLTMPAGGNEVFSMAFDASGDLWASSTGNNTIYEFTGPFSATATLVPAATIATGVCGRPEGLGFDLVGNLYAACESSTGAANAVGVFLKGAGFSNATTLAYTLIGPGAPEALAFDKSGNLYVGSDLAPPSAGIAEFLSTNLATGASPNVFDSTGMLANPFPAQFAFDSVGNIYDADCGSTAHIYVYPTGTSALSATLAPSAIYTDANIAFAGCVEGIATH
jgi:hypothetical protein